MNRFLKLNARTWLRQDPHPVYVDVDRILAVEEDTSFDEDTKSVIYGDNDMAFYCTEPVEVVMDMINRIGGVGFSPRMSKLLKE
jgi:hypothetical protein